MTGLTRDLIHRLPKVELHVHLDGCLRPQTMLELARQQGAAKQAGAVPEREVSAVAASSAFPPVLSPLRLELDPASFTPGSGLDLQREPFTSDVWLSDGGVYDNLGLETAFKRYDTILVSDAGAKMEPQGEPESDWGRHSMRILDLIDNRRSDMDLSPLRLVADCLLMPADQSENVDIQGPHYTMNQVAQTLASALGQPLQVVEIPPSGWTEALTQAGMSTPVAEAFAEMYGAFAAGSFQPAGDRLTEGTTPIEEVIGALIG